LAISSQPAARAGEARAMVASSAKAAIDPVVFLKFIAIWPLAVMRGLDPRIH
jgi:hypothetical protein